MATTPRPDTRLSLSIALFVALGVAAGLLPGQAPEPVAPASAARPLPPFVSQVEAVQAAAAPAAVAGAPRNAGWASRQATLEGDTTSAHRHARWIVPAPAKPVVQDKERTKPAKVKPAPHPAPSKSTTTKKKPAYVGTNHFWVPALGMSYGVRSYACGRTSVPLNHIYRWGCAGRNNVYLLGHAWGVMKPLHDLYVRGGLHRGLVALYADGAGRVRKYKVTEWRVVRPTEIAWQIAAQPVPSMTLQTCIGKNSEWRLNVRLVAVN